MEPLTLPSRISPWPLGMRLAIIATGYKLRVLACMMVVVIREVESG